MNRILKYGVFTTLTICYCLLYTSKLSHIITYHEQHHLFLYSGAYFEQQLQTAGILSYLTDFIIQFFHHPALGSGLLALMIAMVYLLCHTALRKLTGQEDPFHFSVIPSLLLFFHTMEANHSLIPVTATLLTFIALHLLLWLFHRHLPLFPAFSHISMKKKLRTTFSVIALSAYAGYGTYHFMDNYNTDERRMLKAEQHARAKNWDKVLGYTYAFMSTGKTNQLIAYYHHLARYHRGELLNHLFEYPQHLGVKALYIPWSTNIHETEHGHFLYEALGHINEAHRWEFEAMVAWGETAPHLLNLARYNIVNHRPRVAQRFINKLKQSLFYRKEALRLEALIDRRDTPNLRNALEHVKDTASHYTNPVQLAVELEYLCDHDPKNKMAFEYLMSHLLLANNMPRFVKNLSRIRNFDYPSMPPIFEEALLVHKLRVGEEAFAQTGFTISETTTARFDHYYQLAKEDRLSELQREFGKSYWFYLNHINPYRKK